MNILGYVFMSISALQAIFFIGRGIFRALFQPKQNYKHGYYWLGPIGDGLITAILLHGLISLLMVIIGSIVEKIWTTI